IAVRRVEKLFCKNERAVVELALPRAGESVTMVPVASILVASIKLHCLGEVLDLRYRGPNVLRPRRTDFAQGDELGWFESGSTIILCASGPFAFADDIAEGATIRMGRPLLRRREGRRLT